MANNTGSISRYRALLGVFVLALSTGGCTETTGGRPDAAADGEVRDAARGEAPMRPDGQGPLEQGADAARGDSGVPATTTLYTAGNKIYLPSGKLFHGRGANIQDTRGCNACTWWAPDVAEVTRRIDELVDVWGANFMRLTLESYADAQGRVHYKDVLTDPAYLADIQAIVAHVGTKKDVYLLLSVWIDPSIDAMGWPTVQTQQVWTKLATTFAHTKHVLFGVVNEPQSNDSGAQDAACWTAMNDAVTAIRQAESAAGGLSHVVTVQGTRGWARRLDYYVTHPITAGGGKNVAYETHAYNPASDFDAIFINPAKTLPVIIGEFGPDGTYMKMEDVPKLMDEAEKIDVPYLAWTFHQRCPPNLLVDQTGSGCGVNMTLEPTAWGKLLKQRLAQPWP